MRRRRFISLLGGAALAPLTASRVYADPSDGRGVPVARDDGWPVASVNEDKLIDRDALCRMADRLAASSDANIHAVVVARGGKLAFEQYFRGVDEIPGRLYGRRVEDVSFDADTLHDVKSVSKSVASLAVGIAIDRGLIRSVNEPIFSFFPELSHFTIMDPESNGCQYGPTLTRDFSRDAFKTSLLLETGTGIRTARMEPARARRVSVVCRAVRHDMGDG